MWLPSFLLLSSSLLVTSSSAGGSSGLEPLHRIIRRQQYLDSLGSTVANPSLVTQVFEVVPPILGAGGRVVGAGRPDPFNGVQTTIHGGAECRVSLAVRSFANSYGDPFVGQYEPPACLGKSNTAIMNLTVSSAGRQFDRLSYIFLGDTEIWRWSTAEPRRAGISSTVMKDASAYMPLWRKPQTIIFDLGNLLNQQLTGVFHTVLDITFFEAPSSLATAHEIIPLSRRQSLAGGQSTFSIPNDDYEYIGVTMVNGFPRNARKAIVTIQSDGQGDDEFWWSNLPNSTAQTFSPDGASSAGSPYREIQLYIDGQLAGVQPPFPVIFTGGINPAMWNPMVGIDVFDEEEGQIDITPFLPLLCDGEPHNFTFRPVGLDDNFRSATLASQVTSWWKVSGKIFVWKEKDANFITTGTPPKVDTTPPVITLSQRVTRNATGANETLAYNVTVSRIIKVEGSIRTPNGVISTNWNQNIETTVKGIILGQGNVTIVDFYTHATSMSKRGAGTELSISQDYPLFVNMTLSQLPNGTLKSDTNIRRGRTTVAALTPEPVFPTGLQLFSVIDRTARAIPGFKSTFLTADQDIEATVMRPPHTTNITFIRSINHGTMTFQGRQDPGAPTELYFRDVAAVSDGSIQAEVERVAGEFVPLGKAGTRPAAPLLRNLPSF